MIKLLSLICNFCTKISEWRKEDMVQILEKKSMNCINSLKVKVKIYEIYEQFESERKMSKSL